MDLLLLFVAAIVLALYAWVSLAPNAVHAVFARLSSTLTGRHTNLLSSRSGTIPRDERGLTTTGPNSAPASGAGVTHVPVLALRHITLSTGSRPYLATEPILIPAERSVLTRGIRLSYGFGIALSFLCAAVAARSVATHPLTAQVWWFGALTIAVGAVILPHWVAYRARVRATLLSIPPFDVAVITALCLVSLVLRLPKLDTLIPFVHGDEAACGIFGRLFNSGQAPLLSIGWYGLPMLSYAIPGLGLQLFGDTLHGLRLTNVCVGTFGIVLTYLLGRELFGRRAG